MTGNKKCRVKGCKENHPKHFCRLCENTDSKHFSSKCPKGITLYHGTHVTNLAPITTQGLRSSSHGRLGPGIYFVAEKRFAEKIAEMRRKGQDCEEAVVFKCHVNLGRCIHVEKASDACQQGDNDSVVAMHPPWCGIQCDFREYCLKDTPKCIIVSIFVNGVEICKNEEKLWGEAVSIIQNLSKDSSKHAIRQTLQDLKEFSKAKDEMFSNIRMVRQRQLAIKFSWHAFFKTVILAFYTCNVIWSLSDLFSMKNDAMKKSLVSYAVFFTVLSMLRIAFIGFQFKVKKEFKLLALLEVIMTFLLEMPMLVSQVHAIKNIENGGDWSSHTWHITMHLEFHLKLIIFLMIDLVCSTIEIYKSGMGISLCNCALRLLGIILLSIVIYVPIHLAQFGWSYKPDLKDFNSSMKIQKGSNIDNLLEITKLIGVIGLWIWTLIGLGIGVCVYYTCCNKQRQ